MSKIGKEDFRSLKGSELELNETGIDSDRIATQLSMLNSYGTGNEVTLTALVHVSEENTILKRKIDSGFFTSEISLNISQVLVLGGGATAFLAGIGSLPLIGASIAALGGSLFFIKRQRQKVQESFSESAFVITELDLKQNQEISDIYRNSNIQDRIKLFSLFVRHFCNNIDLSRIDALITDHPEIDYSVLEFHVKETQPIKDEALEKTFKNLLQDDSFERLRAKIQESEQRRTLFPH